MGSTWSPSDPSPDDVHVSLRLEAVLTNFASMVRQVGWRYRLSEADIDELMQDVRVRLWRAQTNDGQPSDIARADASENDGAPPASYVYRTATTAALDLIRRRRSGYAALHDSVDELVGREHTVDISLVSATSPDRVVEASELAEQVEQAIETIPASRRSVVRMYLAGYPREEIAQLMGWTEAKTRNLLYRGLDDLRQRLQAMGIGTELAS